MVKQYVVEGMEELEDDYFGVCPICGKTDGYLNIFKNHWFYCSKHKKRWLAGYNLFSGWYGETEEDWSRNEKILSEYEEK